MTRFKDGPRFYKPTFFSAPSKRTRCAERKAWNLTWLRGYDGTTLNFKASLNNSSGQKGKLVETRILP